MKLIYQLMFIFFLSCLSKYAYGEKKEEEIPLTKISYILLDDPHIEDKNLPDSLKVIGKTSGKKPVEFPRTKGLSLNRIIDALDVPLAANQTLELNLAVGKSNRWQNWKQLTLPSGPVGRDISLVLYKLSANEKLSVNNSGLITLDNSLAAFPLGGVRIVNVSSLTIYARFGDQEVSLNPKRVGVLPMQKNVNKSISYKFYVKNPKNGKEKLIYQNRMKPNSDKREQLFFYNSRGKKGTKAIPIEMTRSTPLPLGRESIVKEIKNRKERAKLEVPPASED